MLRKEPFPCPNQVKAGEPEQLFMGAAALLVAGDAALLKAVQRRHTETILCQQSVLRYMWNRAAAGAPGRPTWTDRACNHLKGVEYGTIIFFRTSLTAVSGFVNAITFISLLFQTPSYFRCITLKAAVSFLTGDPATGS